MKGEATSRLYKIKGRVTDNRKIKNNIPNGNQIIFHGANETHRLEITERPEILKMKISTGKDEQEQSRKA